MNKRIEELARKVADKLDPEDCMVSDEFLEAFADSIVKECMTTIKLESKWYFDREEWESSNAIQNAARRVKEHFGVA